MKTINKFNRFFGDPTSTLLSQNIDCNFRQPGYSVYIFNRLSDPIDFTRSIVDLELVSTIYLE